MKIKKIISLGLAIIISVMSLNIIYADSANSINKYVSVREGEFNDDVYLRIQPHSGIEMDDKIILTIENGIFDSNIATDSDGYMTDYQYSALGKDKTYDELKFEYEQGLFVFSKETDVFNSVFRDCMILEETTDLPYKLRKISENEAEVYLFVLPDTYAGEIYENINKPEYRIPIPFTATGGGVVKVTVDSNGTSIRGGVTYAIAETEGYDKVTDYTYGSINSVDKYITVKDGDFNDSLNFVIQPNYGVEMDDKIIFTIENGVFDSNIATDSDGYLTDYGYSALGQYESYTYDALKVGYLGYISGGITETGAFDNTLKYVMTAFSTADLPYKLKKISDTELEVYLFALPENYAGRTYGNINKPKYRIPIPFTAVGNNNVKIKINSVNTSISNGTYTIAKNTMSDENFVYTDGSVNSSNKIGIAEDGDFNDEVYLSIQPNYGVAMDDKIIIKLENGIFDEFLDES